MASAFHSDRHTFEKSLMKLAVTIDVEEEGLFLGKYDSGDVPVSNVPELGKLDPLFRQWGIRPTMLVTYPVIRHEPHQDLLLRLREKWSAEIGAHLHHWNTPPLESLPFPQPVPSELMPERLLQAKMENLLEAFKPMGIAPASFRMGRFNMGPKMFSGTAKDGHSSRQQYSPDAELLRRAGSSLCAVGSLLSRPKRPVRAWHIPNIGGSHNDSATRSSPRPVPRPAQKKDRCPGKVGLADTSAPRSTARSTNVDGAEKTASCCVVAPETRWGGADNVFSFVRTYARRLSAAPDRGRCGALSEQAEQVFLLAL